MADNRTRKLDRKAIKRLQKAIQRLDRQIEREIETHPDGAESPFLFDLNDVRWVLELQLQRLDQQMDPPGEWDDRDESREDRIREDRSRKACRADKQFLFDEALGL